MGWEEKFIVYSKLAIDTGYLGERINWCLGNGFTLLVRFKHRNEISLESIRTPSVEQL